MLSVGRVGLLLLLGLLLRLCLLLALVVGPPQFGGLALVVGGALLLRLLLVGTLFVAPRRLGLFAFGLLVVRGPPGGVFPGVPLSLLRFFVCRALAVVVLGAGLLSEAPAPPGFRFLSSRPVIHRWLGGPSPGVRYISQNVKFELMHTG